MAVSHKHMTQASMLFLWRQLSTSFENSCTLCILFMICIFLFWTKNNKMCEEQKGALGTCDFATQSFFVHNSNMFSTNSETMKPSCELQAQSFYKLYCINCNSSTATLSDNFQLLVLRIRRMEILCLLCTQTHTHKKTPRRIKQKHCDRTLVR
jgi:hypothetical protein